MNGFQLDGPPPRSFNKLALFANFSASASKPASYSLESPQLHPNKNVSCFQFNYYLIDDETRNNIIFLYLLSNGNGTSSEGGNLNLIWSTGGASNADLWYHDKVQIDKSGPFQVNYKLIL